jgi:hypothetical protein
MFIEEDDFFDQFQVYQAFLEEIHVNVSDWRFLNSLGQIIQIDKIFRFL